MKKIMSLIMTTAMICGLCIPAFASYVCPFCGATQDVLLDCLDCGQGGSGCLTCTKCTVCNADELAPNSTDVANGTQVEYTGTGSEQYTITVPAALDPGTSGDVTLAGTWATNRVVSVTAQETVTLTNSITASDKKDLAVAFAGIEETGSNTEEQSFTETVSVSDIEAALFGTWDGIFYYNVEIGDYKEIISFIQKGYSYSGVDYDDVVYYAEEGMTWTEWCDSDYNTSVWACRTEMPYYVSMGGGTSFWLYDADKDRAVKPSDIIIANYGYKVYKSVGDIEWTR